MQFEWDENKRLSNIEKHNLDFIWVDEILSKIHVTVNANYRDEELRYLAIGKINDKFVTVVYTLREERYRIISMRRSRSAEKRKYKELYGE